MSVLSFVFGHQSVIISLVTFALIIMTIPARVDRVAAKSPITYSVCSGIPPTAYESSGAARSAFHGSILKSSGP